jgi:hypothetical protein
MTFRTICLNIDDRRCIKSAIKSNDQTYETTLELDSHVDTCVLRGHALITLDHNRPVAVMGYDESLGTKTYKTVSGVVAYTDPKTGRTLNLLELSPKVTYVMYPYLESLENRVPSHAYR